MLKHPAHHNVEPSLEILIDPVLLFVSLAVPQRLGSRTSGDRRPRSGRAPSHRQGRRLGAQPKAFLVIHVCTACGSAKRWLNEAMSVVRSGPPVGCAPQS